MIELVDAMPQILADTPTIHITEATGFTFLRVVQTPCPVNCYVTLIPAQPSSALCCSSAVRFKQMSPPTHGTTSGYRTIIEQPIKHWAIITDVIYVRWFQYHIQ